MTLDVENLPSVAHRKNQVSRDFRYARDFGSTAKETLKYIASTSWSAYCHTSCGSWCRVPEPVHQYYYLQRSKPRESTFQKCRTRQVPMGLCDREVCARKSPWQGLEQFQITCIKRKFRLD